MSLILRAFILLGLVVAAPPVPVLAQAPGPLADSLRGFAHRMAAVLRARDADGALGLYGDTLGFVHVDNGRIIRWPELSASVRRYLSTTTTNPIFVVGEPGVTIGDEDNAVVYVTHDFGPPAGGPAHRGVWTGVLHRFPGGWRIIHSHSSDQVEPTR